MTRKKTDSAEFERRVTETIVKIAECMPTHNIVDYMIANWGIARAQAFRYVGWANMRIQKTHEHKRATALNETLVRHDLLRRHGFANKNYDLVLDTDKEDAKLLGLYATEKHEVTLIGKDLDAAISAELAKLAGASEAGSAGEDSGTQRD